MASNSNIINKTKESREKILNSLSPINPSIENYYNNTSSFSYNFINVTVGAPSEKALRKIDGKPASRFIMARITTASRSKRLKPNFEHNMPKAL